MRENEKIRRNSGSKQLWRIFLDNVEKLSAFTMNVTVC